MLRTFRSATRLGSVFAGIVLAAPLSHSAALPTADLGDLAQQANTSLGLSQSVVGLIDVTAIDDQHVVATVQVPAGTVMLDLAAHSVRAPGFQVLAQVADGSYVAVEPGPVRTYLGDVVGVSGSMASASWLDEGLFARVTLGDGQDYWIQPLAALLDDAMPEHHVIYRTQDVLPIDARCGTDLLAPGPQLPFLPKSGGGALFMTANNVAQLACDADFEFFQDYGTVAATQNRIESVIGTMNTQYTNQVDISHTITTIIVRTSASQPYTSTDAGTLLDQFRNHWNSSQGAVQRDVAHLFTGKSLNGSTIGVAWVGVVCNLSFAYGLVESNFNNNFSCATDLSAHELGHNWNAGHCSCSSSTMNPSITCANSFHPTLSVPSIVAYRNSISCLSTGGGGGPTAIHVASIVPGLTSGVRKKALVTVSIQNDQGGAVSGASVVVQITGDITETVSGTTGSGGTVVLTSTQFKVNTLKYTACVTSVTGPLPYNAGANTETCDSN